MSEIKAIQSNPFDDAMNIMLHHQKYTQSINHALYGIHRIDIVMDEVYDLCTSNDSLWGWGIQWLRILDDIRKDVRKSLTQLSAQ